MASNHIPTAGAIYDPATLQFCSTAGLATVNSKRSSLNDLRSGLMQSLRDVDSAETTEARLAAGLMAVKIVKASCDSFLSIAAEFAGPLGKMLNGAYKATDSLASAGMKAGLGQQVDWGRTGIEAASGAFTAVSGYHGARSEVLKTVAAGRRAGVESIARRGFEDHVFRGDIGPNSLKMAKATEAAYKTGERVAKSGTIPGKIIVSAMQQDHSKMTRDVFSGYLGEIASLSADVLNNVRGKQVVAIGRGIVDGGLKVYDAVEEFKKSESGSVYAGLRKSLKAQLTGISAKIAELDRIVQDCSVRLASAETSRASLRS